MTAVAPDRAPPRRFACLDGLRGSGTVIVVAGHLLHRYRPTWASPFSLEVLHSLGELAVMLFFATSGFLLFHPFVAATLDDRRPPKVTDFYARRAMRILPGYWLALAAFLAVAAPSARTPGAAATSALLVQNYRSGMTLSGLSVAWTLVVEVSFYAALPVMALLLCRRAGSPARRFDALVTGLLLLMAAGIVLRAASVTIFASEFNGIGGWFPLAQMGNWLPGRLDTFAVGMLFAVYSVRARGRMSTAPPVVIRRLAGAPNVAWLIAAAAMWLAVEMFTTTPVGLSLSLFLASVLWTAAGALLLVPLVFADHEGGALRGVLLHPVLQFLGRISFGIYLWHAFWMAQMDLGWRTAGWLGAGWPGRMAAVSGLTLLCAWLSFLFVEGPAMRWGHGGRRQPAHRGA